MRAKGAPVELDPVSRPNPESEAPASDGPATRVGEWRPRVPRLACLPSSTLLRPAGLPAVLLATLIAVGLTLGVATWGVVTSRNSAAIAGLTAAAAAAVAMALGARASIREAAGTSEVLDRTLAEAKRARAELLITNERLQRRNAELQALELAVEEGFDWIDERTQGRLRDLVEEAGDELAALVDEMLDAPRRSGHET